MYENIDVFAALTASHGKVTGKTARTKARAVVGLAVVKIVIDKPTRNTTEALAAITNPAVDVAVRLPAHSGATKTTMGALKQGADTRPMLAHFYNETTKYTTESVDKLAEAKYGIAKPEPATVASEPASEPVEPEPEPASETATEPEPATVASEPVSESEPESKPANGQSPKRSRARV